jgi:hypothetical protein
MTMDGTILKAICKYGERYRREFLTHYKKDELLKEWQQSLEFFFDKAFFQGRRDAVSRKVKTAAWGVLGSQFSQVRGNLNRLGLDDLKRALRAKIGKGKIGKARDVEMVISTLRYLRDLPNWNIVAYSVDRIKAGEIGEHYRGLQKSRHDKGIVQVGPKIAPFYLRDVVSLFALEDEIQGDEYHFLVPVDTWVRQVARKMKIAPDDASDPRIRHEIISLCRKNHCSPVLFNQGAWYAGVFALDLLLESLASKTA